jgi:hypothetical protein
MSSADVTAGAAANVNLDILKLAGVAHHQERRGA